MSTIALQDKVAITIPCYNEVAYIEKCIMSFIQQNYPAQCISIFVADGMSTDGTREIIQKLGTQYPQVILIDNVAKVTPVALNLGTKASDAPIQIIFGAHAEANPDFVLECVKSLDENPNAGLVGGIIENVYETPTSEIIGKSMSSLFGVGNAHFRTGTAEGEVDTVAFGAYRKKVLEEVGYFDEDLVRNQDDELSYRILKAGHKIILHKKIRSTYFVRGSYGKLFKQYYQYGYWKVYVNKKHNAITTIRQLIPFGFVSLLLLGLLTILAFRPFLFIYLAGILIYLLTSALFASRKANSGKEVLGLMFAFAILHFSYGYGYLVGIVDFYVLGKKPGARNTEISR
ncbi:MAG: glycosyltransferase family 2 protein [Flavobacteriales bacterium]